MWLSISLNLMLGEFISTIFPKIINGTFSVVRQSHGQTLLNEDVWCPSPAPLSVLLCASYWCVSLSLSLSPSLFLAFSSFWFVLKSMSLPPLTTIGITKSYTPPLSLSLFPFLSLPLPLSLSLSLSLLLSLPSPSSSLSSFHQFFDHIILCLSDQVILYDSISALKSNFTSSPFIQNLKNCQSFPLSLICPSLINCPSLSL